MWPFHKQTSALPPEDVSKDGFTARYDPKLKHWVFVHERIEFNLSGVPFDINAFEWAKEALMVLRTLDGQIRSSVIECLEGWPCDQTRAEILCVDLDEYGEGKTLDVAFVGDETWGDFGVNVIITEGKIVDAYGGD